MMLFIKFYFKKSISIDLIPKEIQNVIAYLPSDQIYLLSNGKEIRSNKLNQFMQEVKYNVYMCLI